MKETLENRKRRTKRKVRKRNDCLNKEKKITEREREGGGERMGHFYALSILVDRVNGGGARFYVARGSSVRNNCTLKTFLENDRFVSSIN